MKLSKEFLVLLNAALSGNTSEGGVMDILTYASPEEWQKITAISREQNVTGLVGDAVTNLPEKIAIPENVFLYFLAEKEKRAACHAVDLLAVIAFGDDVVHGAHPLSHGVFHTTFIIPVGRAICQRVCRKAVKKVEKSRPEILTGDKRNYIIKT